MYFFFINNTDKRFREYLPDCFFERLSHNSQEAIIGEYDGSPLAKDYLRFITEELKPIIDAFEDFMRYKSEEKSRNRNPDISREDWLAVKRRELHSRMRRRREASRRRAAGRGGSGRPRFRLF